jgi:hypothetical protein
VLLSWDRKNIDLEATSYWDSLLAYQIPETKEQMSRKLEELHIPRSQ